MKKINKAFTLVELIVVITILAVLWTIAFVSFQWYAANSRDSLRITDLSNISKAIKLRVTAWETLLMPDRSIEIQSEGRIINYQWLMSQKLLSHYWISNWWLDPVDWNPYAFAINNYKNKHQILSFLESGDNIAFLQNQSYADNLNKFHVSKWDTLGILLDPVDNTTIIQSWSLVNIDIATTNDNYSLATIDAQEISSWSKEFLKEAMSFRVDAYKNCNNLLLNWLSKWNGIYTIKPNWNDPVRVYCDMVSDNIWWTLLITTNKDSVAFWNNNTDVNEWYKNNELWNIPKNNESVYSNKDYKSLAYGSLNTKKIWLCLKNSNRCYVFNHEKDIPMFDFFDKWISYKEAWYNNYGSFNYSFNENKITDFYNKIGISVDRAAKGCWWFGINKATNNWAIWMIADSNYWCNYQEADTQTYDDGSLWIWLNSCLDGSPSVPSPCTSWWTTAKSGILRNIINEDNIKVGDVLMGGWAVWGQ